MIFQAFLKNKALKPSGPGALLLSITEIMFQTSCLEVRQSKAAKQSVETLGPLLQIEMEGVWVSS